MRQAKAANGLWRKTIRGARRARASGDYGTFKERGLLPIQHHTVTMDASLVALPYFVP